MKIVWGPEVDRGKIKLHLIDTDGQELCSAWVQKGCTESWAVVVFRELSGELPIDVTPTHVYCT